MALPATSHKEHAVAEKKALLERHPELAGKFETQLVETVDRLQRDGEEASRAALKKGGTIFAQNGRDLAVVLFPAEGASTVDLRAAVENLGATVIRQDEHTLKLAVPLEKLAGLAGLDGVERVRTLRPPRETSITQGRTATLASNWQTGGATGAGSKVAIIDSGFLGYASLITQGELPANLTTVNFSAGAMDSGSNHGSACAEIVHDMAPGADLVLIDVDDPTDLVTAAAFCVDNGVKVVSFSLGYDGMNFQDGIAYQNWFSSVATHPVTAVNNATANGILWVNAAGNEQRQQTVIDWVDANSDTTLDWTSAQGNLNTLWWYNSTTQSLTTSIPAGEVLNVILTWNQWGTTNQDFDLLLFKNTGSGWVPVTTGFNPGYDGQDIQSGSATSYPEEEFIYQTTDASAQYAVAIKSYGTTTTPKFILRYYGVDEPNYFGFDNTSTAPAGSIAIPGDAASSFTVGALYWSTYTTGPIEFYSSLGPNNRAFTGGTAVIKPDICGPVYVDTFSKGAGVFGGTSAATPHIAGLATLARAAYPTMTVAETRTYLEAKALDRGTAGKDNTYGSGAARVTSEAPPVVASINLSSASPAAPGAVQFDVTFSKSVAGGAASNFQLITTGVSGASITSVTGSGTNRTVTVNTGTGTGTVGINMINSTGVADTVSNAVAGLPFTGQIYTIALPDISLAVSPSSMAEDVAGTMAYTFTRTGGTANALTVNFSVSGSAAFSTDYTQSGAASFGASSGTVTFAAGSPTAVVSIDPTLDTTVESNETVVLTVTSGSGYAVGSPAAATGTISNDDSDASLTLFPTFQNEDTSGTLDFTFTRSGATSGALTMNFSVGGTATFVTDYTVTGAATFSESIGTVYFGSGVTTVVVSVDPTSDINLEGDETVVLTITPGSGYNVGGPSSAAATIFNDEASISVSVSPTSLNEDAAGTLAYTFTRAGYGGTPLTVGFNVGGTAVFGTDYAQTGAATFGASSGTVQFGLGITSVTVSIDPTSDATPESDETVILSVASSISYVTGSPSSATGTLLNDDLAAVSVAVSPSNMAEDAVGTMAYTFTRSGPTTSALTINFSVGGTAIFNTDYTQSGAASFAASTGTVTFAVGATTAVVNLDPTADTTLESDETAVLTVTSGAGYSVGSPAAATGTINNDDTTVTVAVAPSSMNEDTAGTLAYTFTRSGVTAGVLTANFSVGGTAVFSADYTQSGAATFTGSSGTVTFAAGTTTAVVNLDPTADTAVESDETVIITVASGSGYTPSGSPATFTIQNDDTSVSVAVSPSSISEDTAGTMSFTFTRSGITSSALTANFNVGVGGTATFNTDYTQTGAATFSASGGTVTFTAGASTAVVNIDPSADTLFETDETVNITLASGTGYSAGSPASATGTISNDDTAPTINWNASTSSVAENSVSTTIGATLSAVSGANVSVHVTVTGSASNGTDYEFAGLPLELFITIPAGQTTGTVTLNPINDSLDETDETVVLTMDNPSPPNATLGTPFVHTLTLIDDENPEIVIEQPSGTGLTDGTANIAFGSSSVGSPVVRTFTVRNTGTAVLSGLAVTKDGSNSGDFVVGSLGSTSLAAGANTTFDVTFTPSIPGARSAAIHVASNDSDENPFDIQLTGSGISTNPTSFFDDFDPAIDTPLWPAFGGTVTANTYAQAAGPGSTGNSLHFDGAGSRFALTQVLNTQAGGSIGFLFAMANGTSLTWESADVGEEVVLEYTLDGTAFVQFAGPYSHRQWQHIVVPIPAAAQATATQFRFRQLGNSGISFDHWALDDVQIASTVATFPEIGVEQPAGAILTDNVSSAGFGAVTTASNASLTFTIRNQGSASLTGLSVTIDGTNASDFTVTTPPSTSAAPAATTTFVVRFAPSAVGARTANLHVASNDANENSFDLTLTGTGVLPAPEITVEQPSGTGLVDGVSSKNFGSVILNGNSSLVFTVRNVGTATLSGVGVTISGSNAGDFTVTASPTTSVAVGASTAFTIRFAPSALGVRNATLQIASNDADENPFDIALTGTGSVTGTYTFDASDVGWYDSTGFHDPANVNYLTGYNNTAPFLDHRSFFIFNLPVLQPGETIVSAELRIDNPSGGFISLDATETLAISDVSSNLTTLAAGTGGTAVFQDLGDGTVFGGPLSVSSANNAATVVIPLNGAFISSIPPSGNTTVALGGKLTSLRPTPAAGEAIFAFSGNQFARLVITTSLPPEIVVEQPAGTDLTDGTASVNCGTAGTGLPGVAGNVRTFTIRNTGLGAMNGIAITKDGSNSADFSIGSLGATTLAAAASTTFTVSFAPGSGASGNRTATLHIASNDLDENPFDIALSGLALSTTLDTDNDGMKDWSEYQLAALGFDWQADNTALVSTYFAAANSNGLYTTAQVQALNVGTPLIQKNPTTGVFTLTIGVGKSTTLQPGSFSPFPFISPGTTINGQGQIEFQFTVPDNAAFFRLQAQ